MLMDDGIKRVIQDTDGAAALCLFPLTARLRHDQRRPSGGLLNTQVPC